MQKQPLHETLSKYVGVTISEKDGSRGSGTYKNKGVYEAITENFKDDLYSLKRIPATAYPIAHYVLWKWAYRKSFYDSHLRGVFTYEILRKVKSSDADLPEYGATVSKNLALLDSPKLIEAYLVVAFYLYELNPAYINFDVVPKSLHRKIKRHGTS